jgi:hypothetical protein
MGEYVRGWIDSGWANNIGSETANIQAYNTAQARGIYREVDLHQLGGLVVICSKYLYDTEEAIQRAAKIPTVNLSFDRLGRLMTTGQLIEAAGAQERNNLKYQLETHRRNIGGSEEIHEEWLLPMHAIHGITSLEQI